MYRRFPAKLVCVLTLATFACGCATTLSPRQKRLLSTRVIDGAFDDTYRATLNVIQDHGYTIRYTDRESGVITAYVHEGKGDVNGYELSCVIHERPDERSEVRFSIQRDIRATDRPWLVELLDSSSPTVDDPKTYGTLFTEIHVEVQRLQALR